jgi:hypothetical protein
MAPTRIYTKSTGLMVRLFELSWPRSLSLIRSFLIMTFRGAPE